jgi:hypothetical protein
MIPRCFCDKTLLVLQEAGPFLSMRGCVWKHVLPDGGLPFLSAKVARALCHLHCFTVYTTFSSVCSGQRLHGRALCVLAERRGCGWPRWPRQYIIVGVAPHTQLKRRRRCCGPMHVPVLRPGYIDMHPEWHPMCLLRLGTATRARAPPRVLPSLSEIGLENAGVKGRSGISSVESRARHCVAAR